MNPEPLIRRMSRFAATLNSAVQSFSTAELRWRPADGGWSVLEIIGHLLAEERQDFRIRLKLTLFAEDEAWPPIDPEAAVRDERYHEAAAGDLLQEFDEERQKSVAWLSSLTDADWQASWQHPKWGVFHAGDLLASWCAHDALHLRQIAKRMYQITVIDSDPYDVRYAGEWRA